MLVLSIIDARAQDWTFLWLADSIRGLFAAVLNVSVWTWATELAHPSYRGPMVGIINCLYYAGQLPATVVPLGTIKIAGDWSWRSCLFFQCLPPLLILLLCLFIPESPRWLIANGREADAHSVMVSTAIVHISLTGEDKILQGRGFERPNRAAYLTGDAR